VDILTLGSRSMSVDVEGFREAVAGPPSRLRRDTPQLVPCFDDHHATDGYRFQPIEFLRGVFANWWQQGADGVATFNWGNAPADVAAATLARWGRGEFNEAPSSHGEAYLEVGDPQAMAGRDKVFAVERRGGYPWAEGAFNRNDDAPLPVTLRFNGTPTDLTIRIADDLSDSAAEVRLQLVLFGAREEDTIAARLNGEPLADGAYDFDWKDPQLFAPNPQPPSGGNGRYEVRPDQRLLRVEFTVPTTACRTGRNDVSVAIANRAPHCCQEIVLEKLEVHLAYGKRD
jgi:hypothetical protein